MAVSTADRVIRVLYEFNLPPGASLCNAWNVGGDGQVARTNPPPVECKMKFTLQQQQQQYGVNCRYAPVSPDDKEFKLSAAFDATIGLSGELGVAMPVDRLQRPSPFMAWLHQPVVISVIENYEDTSM